MQGEEFGYKCTLPYNHDGDHAAEEITTDEAGTPIYGPEIYAVWRRETLV